MNIKLWLNLCKIRIISVSLYIIAPLVALSKLYRPEIGYKFIRTYSYIYVCEKMISKMLVILWWLTPIMGYVSLYKLPYHNRERNWMVSIKSHFSYTKRFIWYSSQPWHKIHMTPYQFEYITRLQSLFFNNLYGSLW